MELTVDPLYGPGSIPGRDGVFQGPTHPEPVWQAMAQSPLNGTTLPVGIEEEG